MRARSAITAKEEPRAGGAGAFTDMPLILLLTSETILSSYVICCVSVVYPLVISVLVLVLSIDLGGCGGGCDIGAGGAGDAGGGEAALTTEWEQSSTLSSIYSDPSAALPSSWSC